MLVKKSSLQIEQLIIKILQEYFKFDSMRWTAIPGRSPSAPVRSFYRPPSVSDIYDDLDQEGISSEDFERVRKSMARTGRIIVRNEILTIHSFLIGKAVHGEFSIAKFPDLAQSRVYLKPSLLDLKDVDVVYYNGVFPGFLGDESQ